MKLATNQWLTWLLFSPQTKEAELKAVEMELSKVDNKTKIETMLQEEAAILQDTKDRELERLADAAEKAAKVSTIFLPLVPSLWELLEKIWSRMKNK